MQGIDKGTRLSNYLIDFMVICIVWFFVVMILGLFDGTLIFYLLMFGYYFIFEATTGQTLGKMITKTRVVYKDGSHPSLLRIMMRSFFRLVPFDAMSYLFGYEKGFHDILSSTKLERKTKPTE